ncbi:MAG: response regulator [Desulfoarculaceae bacterium]|nr:response regulator [Desulfoarculaceae bacterium]
MQKITRIVLIDDDEDLCDLLKMELEASGRFQVTTSTRSESALALIRKERPDLAILDINMPEMHGVELATSLAQEPQTAAIPVLYLTGMISPQEVSRIGGGHTLQTLVSKQSPIAELIAVIDSLLPLSPTAGSSLA